MSGTDIFYENMHQIIENENFRRGPKLLHDRVYFTYNLPYGASGVLRGGLVVQAPSEIGFDGGVLSCIVQKNPLRNMKENPPKLESRYATGTGARTHTNHDMSLPHVSRWAVRAFRSNMYICYFSLQFSFFILRFIFVTFALSLCQ